MQGRYANGARLQYMSRMFYKGPTKPDSNEPADFPFENQDPIEISKEALLYESARQHYVILDLCVNAVQEVLNTGLYAVRNGPQDNINHNPAGNGRGSGVNGDNQAQGDTNAATDSHPAPADTIASTHDHSEAGDAGPIPGPRGPGYVAGIRGIQEPREVPEPSDKPRTPRPNPRQEQAAEQKADTVGILQQQAEQLRDSVAATRGEGAPKSKRARELSVGQGAAIVMKAAPLLAKLAAMRECVLKTMIEFGCKADTKEAFMQDRAVAVVHATALHLDEEFQELGFGAWMPFRWPDQWLSFCGVLRRVLAANGLIHSKHADVYRKLLDETPPVEFERDPEKRLRQSRIPKNLARGFRLQSAETLEDLSDWVLYRGPPPGFDNPK